MSQGKRKRKGKGRRPKPRPAPAPDAASSSGAESAAAGATEAEAPASRGKGRETRAKGAQERRERREAQAAERSERRAAGAGGLPLERERSRGKLVGIVGLASIAATFVAIAFSTKATSDGPQELSFSGDVGRDVDDAERLTDYAAHESDQLISTALHVGALLMAIVIGVYLYWLVRNRTPSVPRWVLYLAYVGPVVFASAAALGFVALNDVADEFVSLPQGEQTPDRAESLREDSTIFQVAQIVDIAGRMVFAAWVGFISREAMNVELLTRFLGIFGIGASFAMVLSILGITIGEAMYIGWLGSVAILALGRWPGGRPEGWDYRVDPLDVGHKRGAF